jgi:hypothetical protein
MLSKYSFIPHPSSLLLSILFEPAGHFLQLPFLSVALNQKNIFLAAVGN